MLSLPRARFKLEFERDALIALLSAVFVVGVLFWKLGTVTPGLGPNEVAARTASASAHLLYNQPVNAPHNLWLYLLAKVHARSFFWLRSVSVAFAIVFCVAFYKIARSWFGKPVAWLTTLLFTTTPLLLLAGRSVSPEIMYLTPMLLTAVYFWLTRLEKASPPIYLGLIALTAICLYVPGGIWLIALGYFFAKNGFRKLYGHFPKKLSLIGLLLFLLIIAPLVDSLIKQPHLARQLALVPATWPAPFTALRQIGWSAVGLVWHSGAHADLQIGKLPLINAAQTILTIFGVMALFSRARVKAYGVALVILLAVVAAGLNDNTTILLIALPALMIFTAAGLRYLIIEWQSIFPRNPIPRTFAYVLVVSVCAVSLIYGVRYSLAAWPNTVSTRATYVLK